MVPSAALMDSDDDRPKAGNSWVSGVAFLRVSWRVFRPAVVAFPFPNPHVFPRTRAEDWYPSVLEARAQFDTDRLVMVRITTSTQDLGDKDFGLGGVAAAVKGIFRSDTRLETQVFDLRTARQFGVCGGNRFDHGTR